MKTNFARKSLLVLITSVSMLAAYNHLSNGSRATASSPQPQAKNTSSQQSQLPDSVTGVYGASSEACSAGDKIIISPTMIASIIPPTTIANGNDISNFGIVDTVTFGEDGYYDVTIVDSSLNEEDIFDSAKLRLVSKGESLVVQAFDGISDTLREGSMFLEKCE